MEFVRLEKIATINPRLPRNVDENQPVSFLSMASVSEDGRLLAEETRSLADVRRGYTYFERGDVLLAKITPCFENGKAVFLGNLKHKIGFGSTEFHVIRADEDRLDPKYLYYLIWSDRFRFFGQKSMKGAAGQKRVSADFLKSFEIPLPPLPEQRRIAAILDKADAIRRKRQQAIRLTEEFLRSVFLDMFGDPVTNPKGWEVVSLGSQTTKIGSGATPRGGRAAYREDGISLIRSMNVHDGKFVIKGLAFIDEEQAKRLNNVQVEENDILLNITGASVARVCRAPKSVLPARVSQHVAIIRTKSTLNPIFLEQLLVSRGMKNKLLRLGGSGATREAITKFQIEELEIICPPVSLQEKFSVYVDRLLAMHQREEKVYKLDTDLFNSLVQRAFRGEL